MPSSVFNKRHKTFAAIVLLSSGLILKPAITSSPPPCVTEYEHTYMGWEEFRAPIAATAPAELRAIGNVVVYQDLLVVPEPNKGVHLIDNTDISAPRKSSFIPIVGAGQIAVVNDVLLARSYVDLVAIDISNAEQAIEVGRVENVFPYDDAPGDNAEGIASADQTQGVVIDVTRHYSCSSGGSYHDSTSYGGCGGGGSSASPAALPDSSSLNVGVAGSMATMLLVEQHLYVLSQDNVITISVAEPQAPSLTNTLNVSLEMETVYYHDNALYIGTRTGVQILDLTDPAHPQKAGLFQHPRQCDPVVVSGTVAYSTLRSGSGCGGAQNQLDVLDVSNIQHPTLITSVDMNEPYGLAEEGSNLFVADGGAGLKILDVTDPANPVLTHTYANFPAKDVILNAGHGVLQGYEHLTQIDYTDLDNIIEISRITAD